MKISSSIEQEVEIDLYDLDDFNLIQKIKNKTTGIYYDLTDYRFEFILYKGRKLITKYIIESGSLTSDFITKTGDDNEILNPVPIWEDIRNNNTDDGVDLKLLEYVFDADGNKYVYINFNINAKRH